MIYFDHNATTPLDPLAKDVFFQAHDAHWHNPSSPYGPAARTHVLLEACREALAALLDCSEELIVFNSGATEGNYSVFQYFHSILSAEHKVVISAVEHPSVRESAQHFFGERCIILGVDQAGAIDLDELAQILKNDSVGLVSLMAANNESGVIQPWQEAGNLCREQGIAFHCDAVQWLGKQPMKGLGEPDFVTGCAHKFGGPKGVGFLKISSSHTGYFALKGGAQEHAHRAGTENYPAVVAMLAALKSKNSLLGTSISSWEAGRSHFEQQVGAAITGSQILGTVANRLPNTTLLLLPEFANTRWVAQLEKQGFLISTGSACATGKEGPSHVLAAMQVNANDAKRVIRVSAGWETTVDDWNQLTQAFMDVWKHLKSESSNQSSPVIEI